MGIITVVQGQTSTTDDDSGSSGTARDRDLDLFNYDTNQHTANYFSFGPEDWGDIRCPNKDLCVRIPHDDTLWCNFGPYDIATMTLFQY